MEARLGLGWGRWMKLSNKLGVIRSKIPSNQIPNTFHKFVVKMSTEWYMTNMSVYGRGGWGGRDVVSPSEARSEMQPAAGNHPGFSTIAVVGISYVRD